MLYIPIITMRATHSVMMSRPVSRTLVGYHLAKSAVASVEITDRCDELPAQKRPDQVVVAAVWSGTEKERFTKVLEQFRSALRRQLRSR